MIGSSVLLFVLGSLLVFVPFTAGAFMIAMGFYLDSLRKFAWWAVITINFLSVTGTLIAYIITSAIYHVPIGLTDFATIVMNVPLGVFIIGYLLRSSIRNLFFEEYPPPVL